MAMNVGGGSGLKSEINITPLVDVVLVLLIIFMVAVPLLQVGYAVDTPPKVQGPPPVTPPDQIVVRMEANGAYYINKDEIPKPEFGARLAKLLEGRKDKLVFFAANGDLPWDKVAEFLDICRNNGATKLGMVFEDLQTGPVTAPANP